MKFLFVVYQFTTREKAARWRTLCLERGLNGVSEELRSGEYWMGAVAIESGLRQSFREDPSRMAYKFTQRHSGHLIALSGCG